MAKTNFSYEKRQRELAQKKKKEEKLKRKQEKNAVPGDPDSAPEGEQSTADTPPSDTLPAN